MLSQSTAMSRVMSQWETLPRHRGGGEERSADRPATAAAAAPVRHVIADGRGGALHSANTSHYITEDSYTYHDVIQ
jgi:hypothetical protein